MARVAGINIPDRKQTWISLTHIYGIGRTTALKICASTGINYDTKIEALNEEDIEKLRKAVSEFLVEGDLRREISTNIKRLMVLERIEELDIEKDYQSEVRELKQMLEPERGQENQLEDR